MNIQFKKNSYSVTMETDTNLCCSCHGDKDTTICFHCDKPLCMKCSKTHFEETVEPLRKLTNLLNERSTQLAQIVESSLEDETGDDKENSETTTTSERPAVSRRRVKSRLDDIKRSANLTISSSQRLSQFIAGLLREADTGIDVDEEHLRDLEDRVTEQLKDLNVVEKDVRMKSQDIFKGISDNQPQESSENDSKTKLQDVVDALKVKVTGPGLDHGVLGDFDSTFSVCTAGAGKGELSVKVKGPKSGFKVEMSKASPKDRTISCRYSPTTSGLYQIYVNWSQWPVHGSPFMVFVFDNDRKLKRFLRHCLKQDTAAESDTKL